MNSTFNEFFGFQDDDAMDQVFRNQEVMDFNTSDLSSESGIDSPSPVPGELPPCRSPFPFTPEQETDLEAVYAANPFLGFIGRDILADALSVTEEDIDVWFIHRRFNDSYLQPRYASSPRPLSPSPEMAPPGFPSSITTTPPASPSAPGAESYLMCPASATVTTTYTSARINHHGPRIGSSRTYQQLASSCGNSAMTATTTTCHRAPVITCRDTASLTMRSRNNCRRRPVASGCLTGNTGVMAARR
ncbi:homeobox protein SEBOX-like [Patiria miniata]|uniref:Homeobox domain-containing protein n=1 Tax=Patiria miniata TaxID=46514 RepID=A0A914A2F4_PATMI|nr:homeobox protein SEBOX-like [Patiria miniata]